MRLLGRAVFNSRWRARSQAHVIGPELRRLGGSLTGCSVLEIGSGCGRGAELVLNDFDAASVQALDVDPVMVRMAAERLGTRASVTNADMAALPFADASYDVVVDFGGLHLADAWRPAIREVVRVLRPGGRFFFEQPLNPFYRRAIPRRGGGRIPGGFGRQELLGEIQDAGLTILGVTSVGLGRLDLTGAARKA